MRKTGLFAMAICFAFALSGARAFAADGTWTKTWTVSSPGAELRVEADYGDVHVVNGAATSIHATVTTYYWRIQPGEVEVSDTQDGNRVEIRIETPKHHDGGLFHMHSPKVYVEVEVPTGTELDLHSGFGDISGENLQGKARVDTGFGKIRFPGFNGQFTGDTGFGDIRMDGRFDRLDVKTGFGSIRAAVARGSKMTDDWRVESGFGSVDVDLPEDLNADIKASSGFGHVSTEIPLAVSGTEEHSSVHGKLGAGGLPLQVSTGFGHVHIGRS